MSFLTRLNLPGRRTVYAVLQGDGQSNCQPQINGNGLFIQLNRCSRLTAPCRLGAKACSFYQTFKQASRVGNLEIDCVS